MNDKLMELVWIAAGGMLSYDAEGDWRLNSKEVDQLALLIIEECFSQIHDRGKYSDGDWTKYKIRKHFGLEE